MKITKWEVLGIIAAVFNPVPTGLIAGYVLWTEKKYRQTGIFVLALSVAVVLLSVYLVSVYSGSDIVPLA